MTISLVMLIIAAAVFSIYSIAMIVFPSRSIESLSESYYLLNENKKGLGYLFSALCLLLSGSIIYPMIELSNGVWYMELLAFLTAGLLLFVAISVEYREELSSKVHYTSAILMVITSQSWIILDGGLSVVLLTSVPTIIMSILRSESYVLWIEIFYGLGTLCHLMIRLYGCY